VRGEAPTLTAEVVSPELALVDPTLRERVRSLLPEPESTLTRLEALVAASRVASAQRRLEGASLRAGAASERSHRPFLGRRRYGVMAGGALASALLATSLVGVRVDLRGVPAVADTAEIDSVHVTSGASRPPAGGATADPGSPARDSAGNASRSQRFAWAPAAGASAYHFELFRESSKVYEADTSHALTTVPPNWEYGGRSHALEPGAYRWYVWPVISGRRAAAAVVQADLVVQ
jgi:hypothetical protein